MVFHEGFLTGLGLLIAVVGFFGTFLITRDLFKDPEISVIISSLISMILYFMSDSLVVVGTVAGVAWLGLYLFRLFRGN